MRTNKLFEVLKNFDQKTNNRLRKFIQSPYFNRDDTLLELFDLYLSEIKSAPELSDKQEIWQLLKPNQPFNDARFRKYQSDLLGLVEKFLVNEQLEEEKNLWNLILLKKLSTDRLKSLQKYSIARSQRKLKDYNDLSPNYYLDKYLLAKEEFNIKYQFNREGRTNINDMISALDQFYYSERFKLASDKVSRGKFIGETVNDPLIDEITQLIDTQAVNLFEVGNLYRLVYESQKFDTTESYYNLRDYLKTLSKSVSKQEGASIYTSLINFCIKKINAGSQEFTKELFEIYKDLIQSQLILTNGKLSPYTYSNIAITALRNKAYDWAENFVFGHAQYLPENQLENFKTFQLSRVYFYKKDFHKVIELLRDFEFTDQINTLQAKTLLIYTYYELKEFDSLDSLLNSFNAYLSRHKEIDSSRRKIFKNLIRIISQMMSIIPGDKKKIKKLKATMAAMKGIAANREWLEEKITELERGK